MTISLLDQFRVTGDREFVGRVQQAMAIVAAQKLQNQDATAAEKEFAIRVSNNPQSFARRAAVFVATQLNDIDHAVALPDNVMLAAITQHWPLFAEHL